MRKALLALLVVASLSAIVQTQHLSTGVNNNLSGCIGDEYVCDPYLRQKVEPKGACSALNGEHCMFVANDYRSVSLSATEGTGEGTSLNETLAKLFGLETKTRLAANPDAWIGIYRCYQGAEGRCVNGLWPGFPSDTPPTATTPKPEFGFAAASDPTCVAGANGEFGCVAMFFDRGGRGVILTRFFRDFNDESRHPIRLDPTIPPVVHVSGSAVAGKFADLCTIFYDGTRWHVAWTQFHRDGAHAWWTSSPDGRTWTVPQNISNPFTSLQRLVFAVDKTSSARRGTVYAMFRTFGPNAYALATLPPNATRFSSPVNISEKSGPASVCAYDAPSRGANEEPIEDRQFARAKDFASFDTGPDGSIYVAHTERVNPNGTPLSVADCSQLTIARSSPAAIVLSRSSDGGQTFTSRRAIDIGVRCETSPQRGLPPADVTPPNATECPTGLARNAGVQLQPSLKMNGGHLMVTYREGRGGLGPADGYFSGRRARIDIRAAQINPTNLSLLATRQVSHYEYDPATGDYVTRVVPDVQSGADIPVPADPTGAHQKVNLPFLPLHQQGATAFMGDSDDLIAVEEHVAEPSGGHSGVHWATPLDVPALRMIAVWGGDTRETGFPLANGVPSISGPWNAYAPPGTGTSCINPTARFSNVFTSVVTGRVEAFAVQTFKPLGGTEKKTWPIVIRNRSKEVALYRVTLHEKPGFVASFDPINPNVKQMGLGAGPSGTCSTAYPTCTPLVRVLPGSSVSLTVFGYPQGTTDVRVPSPIRVLVDDVGTVSQNPDAIIRLNPNPIQYDLPFFGPGANTAERHGRPKVTTLGNEYVKNYSGAPKSPSGGHPSIGDPSIGDPSIGDPSIGDSSITEIQYVVTSGDDPNTASGFQAIANFADAFALDQQQDSRCSGPGNKCHDTQVIVSRTHTIPSVSACTSTVRPGDEIISYTRLGATPSIGDPSIGDPSIGDPSIGDPSIGDPSIGDSTFTLTPLNAPLGTVAAAAYAARAIASAAPALPAQLAPVTGPDGTVVGDPPVDTVLVTYRIVHYHGADVPETAPKTKAEADRTIGVAAIPKAQRNKAGGPRPVAGNDEYSTLVTVTLTVSAADGVLRDDIKVTDNPAPLTARLVSGPSNGTLTFGQDGSFVYKPKGSFVGVDTFRYRAREGTGNTTVESAEATVVIRVLPRR